VAITWHSCPICEGTAELWNRVKGYQLERCLHCGFVFVNPRPDREEMSKYYRSIGGHCRADTISPGEVLERERFFPNSTVDAARMIANTVRVVEPGEPLLDVGSGYGFYSREALRRGFVVEALEIAPFERACTAELVGIEPLDVEFEDLPESPDRYGVVLMSQILEHAVDINEWVAKARRLLRKKGVLCIAVPNFASFLRRALGTRDPFIHPPVHLNYFSQRSAELLLAKHGFVVWRMETISRLPPDALSKRMGNAPQIAKDLTVWAFRRAQKPPLAALDRMHLGMFLNIYAIRT
jgi:SAM-dependent methyltransferase